MEFFVETNEKNHVSFSKPYTSYDDAYDAYCNEIQKRLKADKTGASHAAIRIELTSRDENGGNHSYHAVIYQNSRGTIWE